MVWAQWGTSRALPSPLLSTIWLIDWLVSVLNIMPVCESTLWGEMQIKRPLGQKWNMGVAYQAFMYLLFYFLFKLVSKYKNKTRWHVMLIFACNI